MAQLVFFLLTGSIPFSKNFENLKEKIPSSFLKKLKKKMVVSVSKNLTIFGRMKDSIPHLQEAIDLGYLPATADLALLYFNTDLPDQLSNHPFELLKRGHEYGCPDCTGMLAFYYTKRYIESMYWDDDSDDYYLACQSAAAGSWFGKMALVHFLKRLLGFNNPLLLGVQDPDERTFEVHWEDPFICTFAPEAAPDAAADYWDGNPFQGWSEYDLEYWFEDRNILSQHDIHRILRILIEEIKQEYLRNPYMPQVWRNLPAL